MMTFTDIRNLLSTDPRFKEISDPNKVNDIISKFFPILSSGKLKDSAKRFLNNQIDLDRYVKIAKNVAGLKLIVGNRKGSLQDVNLIANPRDPYDDTAKNIIIDDLRNFYYELDIITSGKHNFSSKIEELLQKTTFVQGKRSSVGATYDNNGNIVESHINIDTEAIINNRTVAPHEMWHAMDEQNYALNTKHKPDQFIGEIGSIFIDKLSVDHIKKTHSSDKALVKGINYLNDPDNKIDYMIEKARQSYAEYLISIILAGSTINDKELAIEELLNNVGILWSARGFEWQINELYDIAKNPDKHFDPMYELRYVIGEAVSDAVYNMDIPLEEKIDKMVSFNENIVSVEKLGDKNQVPLDIVTNFLGVDYIENLINSQYAKRLSLTNKSATQLITK